MGKVNKRTSCMDMAECVRLTALGGRPRPGPPTDHAPVIREVVITRVLCWWCREYHSPLEVEQCMSLPRKRTDVESSGSSSSNALDAGPLKDFSQLWAFLTSTCYEDGAKRRTGRLSVSFASPNLVLLLNDEETGQYACLTGRSLSDLLVDAELRLEADTMPWRASRYGRRGK